MALPAGPELVASFSEAGGVETRGTGVIGPDALRAEVAEVRKITSKPFGIDLVFADVYRDPGPVRRNGEEMAPRLNDEQRAALDKVMDDMLRLGRVGGLIDVRIEGEIAGGQEVGTIDEILPAGEVVRRLVRSAKVALERARRALGEAASDIEVHRSAKAASRISNGG